MKTLNVFVFLAIITSGAASAAGCRSGAAASEGAQNAYENAVKSINSEADSLKNSSEVIGTCISGVTGVVTMPTFPDLGSIWSDMIDQVCKTASDKISDSYNDVIGNINGNINDLMNGVNNSVDKVKDETTGNVKNIWN